MSKTKNRARVFSREFKVSIVRRLLAGESASALARELRFSRKDLYVWRDRFLAGGPEALRGPGRPRKVAGSVASGGRPPPPETAVEDLEVARRQIAALERKVGQQQLELDFFRQALRQVEGARRRSAEPGVSESTKSSKR